MMLDWTKIDTVFLDMDGTLLDLYFDNYFWLEYVPQQYGARHGLDLAMAKQTLYARYQAVHGRLEWYCIDYWTQELQLDIVALKRELAHLIAVFPHTEPFLKTLRHAGKAVVLVTNAHMGSVEIKMAKTGLRDHFDGIVTSHQHGAPKESIAFWSALALDRVFNPLSTVLIDDNLHVLRAAQAFGIRYLMTLRQPDTRRPAQDTGEFMAIDDFSQLMPVR